MVWLVDGGLLHDWEYTALAPAAVAAAVGAGLGLELLAVVAAAAPAAALEPVMVAYIVPVTVGVVVELVPVGVAYTIVAAAPVAPQPVAAGIVGNYAFAPMSNDREPLRTLPVPLLEQPPPEPHLSLTREDPTWPKDSAHSTS